MEPKSEADPIIKLLGYIYNHRKIMVVVFCICMFIGVAFTFLSPKEYEAKTSFFFTEGESLSGILGKFGLSSGGKNSPERMILVLKSEIMMQKVIDKFGERIFGRARLNSTLASILRKELSNIIRANIEKNQLVVVRVTTKDPQLSSDIANYLIENLKAFEKEVKSEAAQRYRKHVEEQEFKVKDELEADDLKLLAFQRKEKIVEPKAEVAAMMEYYYSLKMNSVISKADLDESLSTLSSFRERLATKSRKAIIDEGSFDEIDVPQIQELYSDLLGQELELAKSQQTATGENPKTRKIQAEIGASKSLLKSKLKTYLSEIQTGTNPIIIESYAKAMAKSAKVKALEKLLKKTEEKMGDIPDLAFTYKKLSRGQMIKEKIYALVELELYKALSDEFRSDSNIQVLDKAIPPDFKTKPVTKIYLGVTLLLSTLVSFLFAYLQDRTKQVIARIRIENEFA